MAHMVRYNTFTGNRVAPTVSTRLSAQSHSSAADVMLVTALLNQAYSGAGSLPLPPGARSIIPASANFTSETNRFILDFQNYSVGRNDGIVSVLPIGKTDRELGEYVMFRLWIIVVLRVAGGKEDLMLDYLKGLAHLHNLDARVKEAPLPVAPSESPPGAYPAAGTATGTAA